MNRNSKRLIASVAALQILLYHCWIPILPYGTFFGSVERFLIRTTYSGVDIFFFLSAFSLVSRPVEDYGRFIKNRALKVLPLFFIAWIAGQFLWFLPAIMILYLALPPLYRVCRNRPALSFFLLLLGWMGIVYLILGIIRPAQDLGIFLFRIPSMILGAYAVKYKDKLSSRQATITGIALLALGTVLVYKFGYINRLSTPFRSTFYLMGIPVMLGTILLLDRLASGHSSRLIGHFGSITLELYFSQMVFGTFLVSLLFRMTGSRIITNLATMAAIIAAAAIINAVNNKFTQLFSNAAKRRTQSSSQRQ